MRNVVLLREQYDAIKNIPEDIQLKILAVSKEVVESFKDKKQKGEKAQITVKSSN